MSDSGFHKEHVVGALGLAILAYGSYQGLVVLPPEKYMGEAGRILYVHVPTAWVAMLVATAACFVAIGSLVRGGDRWDAALEATVEMSVVTTGMLIIQGAIWAKPTWNTYWDWDPRLTTSAIMLACFAGVLALRAFVDDPRRRASWSAVATIVAYADVPIVYFSVKWWRTLHQSFSNRETVAETMWDVVFINFGAMVLIVIWLCIQRGRLSMLTRPAQLEASEAPAASPLVAGRS